MVRKRYVGIGCHVPEPEAVRVWREIVEDANLGGPLVWSLRDIFAPFIIKHAPDPIFKIKHEGSGRQVGKTIRSTRSTRGVYHE